MGVHPGKAGSYTAGLLVGFEWWVLADGATSAAHHNSQIPFDFVKYLPGVVSTIAIFLWNLSYNTAVLQGEHGRLGDAVGGRMLRLWFVGGDKSSCDQRIIRIISLTI
ncbi:Vacuolar targeting-like protein [Phytophthora palmivora]|uniref:Vacuolar targeting-like protein n=1 Tax=Phytophthora palmivora TaxID=4796 RepID=A0A2P4X551_9STRA|nr:Vacuolar targeting-like protein [Phytophthora palmivora]